jgi:Na+-translocating ferredoxin:NAD+ oxidoreductase RnfG subunit
MIPYVLIALLVMALISAGAILAAVLQGKRAKKAEAEVKALHEAFWQVKEKAERLQKALGETAKVEEEADAERTELSRTPDTDLAGRANSLFLQNGRNGKSAGNAGPVTAAGAGSAGDGAGQV